MISSTTSCTSPCDLFFLQPSLLPSPCDLFFLQPPLLATPCTSPCIPLALARPFRLSSQAGHLLFFRAPVGRCAGGGVRCAGGGGLKAYTSPSRPVATAPGMSGMRKCSCCTSSGRRCAAAPAGPSPRYRGCDGGSATKRRERRPSEMAPAGAYGVARRAETLARSGTGTSKELATSSG